MKTASWRWLPPAACLILLSLCPQWAAAKSPRPRKEPVTIPKVSRDEVICFALYTVHGGTLKLTAQLYPLWKGDSRSVWLEVHKNGAWREITRTTVVNPGWTAPFRVTNWDSSSNVRYRVRHGKSAVYEGLVRKDPVDKDQIVVAAFTGNSSGDRRMKPDIIRNIKAQDPDLLFFSGDQVYDHGKHFAAWLLFGRQFGQIIRDRPTVCIPDDHDVGQGNLWGDGGRKCPSVHGNQGGYFMSPAYVNEVQRAQTSHLPDPYDPAPIQRGIGVYYTRLTVGRVDFAILEDRKFKSGPDRVLSRPRPKSLEAYDVVGATLLGPRQLKFLRCWAADWRGTDMKVVLSQTVFACAHHGVDGKGRTDPDTNGWPQTGRNKALREMRKGFAFHIAGDQHLATVIHHGVDEWGDAGYSFCVPSIVNFFPRYWKPPRPPVKTVPGPLKDIGQYRDGFGNRITTYAYVNPKDAVPRFHYKISSSDANRGADGYGLVRFDKKTRKISIECWPRMVDVTSSNARQYTGWPVTIDQQDNYGRRAAAYLPTIEVTGRADPVVQVIDQSTGQTVYTLRICGKSFRPRVFKVGTYTVKVGEPDTGRWETLRDIRSLPAGQTRTITVSLPSH